MSELKLIPCGCGGEASVCYGFEHRNIYAVECNKCGICTCDYDTEAEAITAWNRAMSSAEPERKKGRLKTVGFLTCQCSECGAQFHELEYTNFCPNCGADMRGEDEDA